MALPSAAVSATDTSQVPTLRPSSMSRSSRCPSGQGTVSRCPSRVTMHASGAWFVPMAIMHGSPACHSTAPSPSQTLAVMPAGRTATRDVREIPAAASAAASLSVTTSGTVISKARTPSASISTLVTQESQGASALGPVTSTYE